ncbi:MAG TPA: family 1 encapsulin nanocompartment shell protein [Chloroflexota bacterium]|nr:family 1 encapsulin nanocompartment shell protein [Chloroflexota bacterium]
MPDYLQREQAPLGPAEWAALDQVVVRTAQAVLVGRRFLSLVGPFGPGVEALPNDVVGGSVGGQIDLLGIAEGEAIAIERRRFLPLPLLYKDFWVHWRDLEASQQLGMPLDLGKAAAAAAATAQTEDRLVFDGEAGLDLPGLRTAEGRQTLPMGDWASMGRAFADVVEGVRVLTQAGFTGPYALAVSPRRYADLNRIFDQTGVLELEQVEKLARRGVYPTAVLPDPAALLVDSGAQNIDLAVGVDLSTAYVESNNLNHRFRVVESLALRIRRPGAICTFEPETRPTSRRG